MVVFACLAAFTFSARAADSEADKMLAEYAAHKAPAFDASHRDDKDYVRQYSADRQAYEQWLAAFDDVTTGKKITMADLKGKVVVIDFWATWCGPCVGEMPNMKKLYSEYKDKGVEFIGVSLDQPGDGLNQLKTFLSKNEITWPQYYQGKGWDSEFSSSWGINSIPTMFVIDAEGKLYSTSARGQLETILPTLLKASTPS